jgi:uncharacterized protein (TIGR00369 family)
MQTQEHYTKLKNMYVSGSINQELYDSAQIEVTFEQAIITQQIEPKYFHAGQSLHGSVYFKLLDDAAYFAVQSIITDAFVYTTTFNIQILRPVKTGSVKAIGKVTFKSKNLYIADAVLYDHKNREVARGSGTFMKSQLPLDDKLGYQQ